MTVLLHQQKVGRFDIRDFLGRGAIGDVLLAWDPERQDEVALKVVRISKSDPEMLEAERNGISLQEQIGRVAPQVAAVYEQGEDGDFYWVCMEYVPGTDLSRVLARGPIAEERALSIACQLCAMLEVCHDFTADIGDRRIHGVVHGDIKPENIRLQEGDRVRVLDFGIAKHLSHTRRFTVNLFGSLPYTPPERLDRGVVDFQSDLWAVGVVLYIMASGRRPFAGTTAEEVERHILDGDLEPLPDTVSPGLQQLIRKSLAFAVDRRYPNAAALRGDLEALEAGRSPASIGGDLDATRRTGRSAEGVAALLDRTDRTDPTDLTRRTDRAAEATRRTHDPVLPGASPPPTPAAPEIGEAASPAYSPAAPFSSLFPEAEPETLLRGRVRRSRRRGWIALSLGLLLVVFGAYQVWLKGQATEIRHELVRSDHPDLLALAERFRRVDTWAILPSRAVSDAREELRDALVRDADQVIEAYHGDNPVTTEKGWQRAYDDLRAAVDLSMLDRQSRAKMLYARAHLDRIASQSLRQKGDVQAANEKLQEAVSGFRSAARWDGDWPDPYLGLARVYSYEKFDLEGLQNALGELGKRGYRLGRREKAMLADGFRMQGRDLQARAQRAEGTDDEERLLREARESFIQSMNFYDEIRGYADVETNRTDAEDRLDAVVTRQRELGDGSPFHFDIHF